MTDPVVPRRLSRRAFLIGMGGVGIPAVVLAACTTPTAANRTQGERDAAQPPVRAERDGIDAR